MPSKTFLNLPPEKQRRFLDAAWAEMETVSFDKVSINRIIQEANISRGSFYQYFEDKQDLLYYLLKTTCDNLKNALLEENKALQGTLVEECLHDFDWIMARREDESLRLSQLVHLIRINPALALDRVMWIDSTEDWTQEIPFWKEEGVAAEDHVRLLYMVLADAILRSFKYPDMIGIVRSQLEKQLKILRRGMLIDAKGEQ